MEYAIYNIVRGNVFVLVDIIIIYFINYLTTIRFVSSTYIDDCILKYRNYYFTVL
jgi:hypothetical protein